eukprot:gene16081-22222_t
MAAVTEHSLFGASARGHPFKFSSLVDELMSLQAQVSVWDIVASCFSWILPCSTSPPPSPSIPSPDSAHVESHTSTHLPPQSQSMGTAAAIQLSSSPPTSEATWCSSSGDSSADEQYDQVGHVQHPLSLLPTSRAMN